MNNFNQDLFNRSNTLLMKVSVSFILSMVYTVECRYNAVQFITILLLALRWRQQNLNQTSNSQQTLPLRASYGESSVRICEKIDRVITAPRCIFQSGLYIFQTWISLWKSQSHAHLTAIVSNEQFLTATFLWKFGISEYIRSTLNVAKYVNSLRPSDAYMRQ